MEEIIALFDMDNTLFDYEGKLLDDMQKLQNPDEPKINHVHEDKSPWMKARRNLIRSVPGWWRKLPKLQLGWDIYQVAENIGFECHILTKGPHKFPHAWTEKVDCIRDHFGTKINIDIVGKDKAGRYGRVLVDDYPGYVLGWLRYRPRGLVVMPAHSYNKDVSHPNIIRYDGNNIEEVESVLRAARKRKNGEHWRNYL